MKRPSGKRDRSLPALEEPMCAAGTLLPALDRSRVGNAALALLLFAFALPSSATAQQPSPDSCDASALLVELDSLAVAFSPSGPFGRVEAAVRELYPLRYAPLETLHVFVARFGGLARSAAELRFSQPPVVWVARVFSRSAGEIYGELLELERLAKSGEESVLPDQWERCATIAGGLSRATAGYRALLDWAIRQQRRD